VDLPETKPCPECGGPRIVHENISPDIDPGSTAAARDWQKLGKEGKFKLVRCTICGYSAFFYMKREPN
jgi:rubredoxin